MKLILTLLIVLSILTVFGQRFATSDDGKKVKLNSNGTWEFIEETTPNRPLSTVFVGGKRLTAGEKTLVHNEKNGLATSISMAKDGEKTLIIFWQETDDQEMNFYNWLWTGTVMLYLDDNETITLTDRNLSGQNKIPNGYKSSSGNKIDLYQRYSTYYLTPSECLKLKRSNLSKVGYNTTSTFEQGTTYLEISENSNTIKEQLSAIKR